MGNGHSTPKGQHVQRTSGGQYEDNTAYSSISSGHYVSARNMAALDAMSTTSNSHDDGIPEYSMIKKRGKKKKKRKQKAKSIDHGNIHQDMFERESFDFSMDLPEFQMSVSPNVNSAEDTYATASSPSVPEFIVDVVRADNNYSLPNVNNYGAQSGEGARAMKDPVSYSVNDSVPHIADDRGSLGVNSSSVINVNDSNIHNVSKHSIHNVNDPSIHKVNDSFTHNVNDSLTHNVNDPSIDKVNGSITHNVNDSFTLNVNDPVNHNVIYPDEKSNTHNDQHAESSDESESVYTDHPDMVSFKPDSGLHYPMIFRRSKKDPGSKEYNEVVKELSSVLEKRARNSRPHSEHDSSPIEELEQRIAKSKLEKQHSFKSTGKLNTNIFANKLLLNKLENHLMNKNRTNQMMNEEQSVNKENNAGSGQYEHMVTNQQKSESNVGIIPGWQKGIHREDNNVQFKKTDGDIYSVPFQNLTSMPDNSFKGSTVSINSVSITSGGSKVTINGGRVTGTQFAPEAIIERDKGYQDYHNSNVKQTNQDLKNNNVNVSNFSSGFSGDAYSGVSQSERGGFGKQYLQHQGNSPAFQQPRDSFRESSPQITPSGSNVTITRYTPRQNTSRHNQSFSSIPDASWPRSHRATAQQGNGDAPGKVTTIRLPGLLRNTSMMRSEPDLTQQGFSSHHGVPTTDGGFKILPLSHSKNDTSASLFQDNRRSSFDAGSYSLDYALYKRSNSGLGRAKSTSDLVRAYQMDSGQFNPNQSYDLSFVDEDLTRSSYHSDVSSSGLSSPRSLVMKVLDSGSSTSSVDTFFMSGDRSSGPSNATSPTRSTPAAMTTIVEHPRRGRYKRVAGGHSSWSVATLDQSGRPGASTPPSIPSRLYHTAERRHQPRYHKNYRTNSRALGSRSDSSVASDNSSSSHKSSTFSNAQANKSHMFIVVPPKSSKVLVPDLIVDHHSTNQTNKNATNTVKHVTNTGSPFHQEISEGTLPTAHGEGLHKGEEDKPATFIIDARNLRGEPTVQVDGPNAIAKCSIDPQPDGQYRVTYIPVEVGLFDVSVRWNGKEIPGSPFHPKVVDARKVKVVGGWHHYMDGQERIHLVVGEEKKIPFDTSEAGPGKMRAEVKSPSAFLPVEVDDEHKGKSVVKFVPKEEGLHHIHLYWSDHPLVNSPYVGFAVNGAADPSKVWLSGQGLKEAIIREEAEFFIDGSQAGPGEPEVELTGVRAEIQVFKTALGGGKYRCTYIPVVPGAYLLNISWNGRQLRGAPYKVNVIGASYPNRVVVNGEGLKGGLMGNSLDFRIDTRKAGPGELTAYCMGPIKVAYCELSDHHDGTYRLVVRPQEVGKHVLQIKYGGEHVQGSPYAFKVSAQPDASKVRVSGPGVEHGILANFQSQFIVQTKGAGAGQLTVRIRGPKGAFQVEMYRESQKDRTILCRYYPSVTGLYIINVRWSGVDVPGSPFQVQILDTQQELEQVFHEQSFSSSGGRPHLGPHPSNSFHNSSLNSSSQLRYSGPPNGQHHNISRSSGYYHQWREEN